MIRIIVATVALALVVCSAFAGGRVVKKVLRAETGGKNLLRADAWRPWKKGFEKEGQVFVCDNGSDAEAHRGVSQRVELNQK